jgi:hypothetical protein
MLRTELPADDSANKKSHLMPKRLTLLFCLFTLSFQSAFAATWYVNSAATGSNNGSSSANAWRGISNIAWSSLRAGDVVYWDYGNGGNYGSMAINASGSAATVAGRIWFVGTGSSRPVLTSVDGGSRDYIGLVGFEITSGTQKTGTAISWNGATGWLVQDCNIHHKSSGITTAGSSTNNYNIIRGTSIQDLSSNGVQVQLQGSYNVLEYSTMGRGGDRLRNFSHHLVYRNCYFTAMAVGDLDGEDPHIDDIQIYRGGIEAPFWSDKCVIESVFTRDSTTNNAHFLQIRDELLTGDYRGLIVRFNIAYNQESLGENQNMANERGYNNTFVDIRTNGNLARWFRGSNVTAADNIWINNSFTRTNNDSNYSPLYTSDGASITQEYNHEYQSGDLSGSNNQENVDPQFTNEGTQNYMPRSTSPLVGRQRPQTRTRAAGSNSTSLSVLDADYFIDGWGVVEGDLIRVGSGNWVRIQSINYSTDTITLASARTWNSGDAVYLFGTQVIGALENRSSGYTLSGSLSGSGSSWMVTPNNAELCRMVVFYEDGVPQAPVYDAPFQFTSSGGTVTAKLYARFASETPVVTATLGGSPPDSPPAAPSSLGGTPSP